MDIGQFDDSTLNAMGYGGKCKRKGPNAWGQPAWDEVGDAPQPEQQDEKASNSDDQEEEEPAWL
eukprot:8885282-Heterocapsa_arctica.AAC.1